jgi:hypothetical protein
MSSAKTLVILPLALGALFVPAASAQVRSATITGSVSDQSGAAVPNADVTITNTGTNAAYKTKTTTVGQFAMPYLEAGNYSVEVTAPGFAAYRETGIAAATDQTVRINVNLRIGAVGEQGRGHSPSCADSNRQHSGRERYHIGSHQRHP